MDKKPMSIAVKDDPSRGAIEWQISRSNTYNPYNNEYILPKGYCTKVGDFNLIKFTIGSDILIFTNERYTSDWCLTIHQTKNYTWLVYNRQPENRYHRSIEWWIQLIPSPLPQKWIKGDTSFSFQ